MFHGNRATQPQPVREFQWNNEIHSSFLTWAWWSRGQGQGWAMGRAEAALLSVQLPFLLFWHAKSESDGICWTLLSFWSASPSRSLTQTMGFFSLQRWWCSLGLRSPERKFRPWHEYGCCCVMCWEGKVHETFFLTLLKSLMFATWTWHYMFFQTNISITKTNKTWNKNWHWNRVNLSCGFWSSLWVSPLPHMCSASCTSLRRDPGCSCTFWFCHLHLSLPGLRGTPPISTKAIVITARDL